MKIRLLVPVACLLALGLPARADDWPQFRGPNRDAVSRESGLLKTWPRKGPPLLWTCTTAGVGYSGPAVVGSRLYTMGARGNTEYLFALDIDDKGKELWSTKIGPMNVWKENYWNTGPASTPTVDGGLVYALGGQGQLVCVKTDDGSVRWRKDLPAELGAEVNPIGGGQGSSGNEPKMGWGYTWSPLVDGRRLICVPGGPQGTLAALDKEDGRLLWRSKDFKDQATYSSPIVAEVGGLRHYVQLTNEGITGVATDGKVLWRYAKTYPDVLIPTPLFHDNHVYATAHQAGCDLVKLTAAGTGIKARKVYANRNMDNLEGGVVRVGSSVYGYSENKGWIRQDFKTGAITASERRKLKGGSLVYADGHLYCYGQDDATVVLVGTAPDQWTSRGWKKEDGRLRIPRRSLLRKPRGKAWTHPVVANGKLFLRDQELLFCFDIKDPGAGKASAAGGEEKHP